MNVSNFSRTVQAVTGTSNGQFGSVYNGAAVTYNLEARWLQILNNGTDGTSTNAKALYVKIMTQFDDGTYEAIIPPLGSLMVTGIRKIGDVLVRCVDGTAGYVVMAHAIN